MSGGPRAASRMVPGFSGEKEGELGWGWRAGSFHRSRWQGRMGAAWGRLEADVSGEATRQEEGPAPDASCSQGAWRAEPGLCHSEAVVWAERAFISEHCNAKQP